MQGGGPLIPNPTTHLDERVNRAYEIAVKEGGRRYVWVHPRDPRETILIGNYRPRVGDNITNVNAVCVLVDPAGFALMLAPGAEEPR